MEIAEAGDSPQALRKIAKALVSAAEGGDLAAIKEFADRLDGKSVQNIDADIKLGIEDVIAALTANG